MPTNSVLIHLAFCHNKMNGNGINLFSLKSTSYAACNFLHSISSLICILDHIANGLNSFNLSLQDLECVRKYKIFAE